MRKYFTIMKSRLMESLAYRFDFIFEFACNVFYILLLYYIWSAVFEAKEKINGMTFSQVFTYLVFSLVVYGSVNTQLIRPLAHQIREGSIVMDFIKPMHFPVKTLFECIGDSIAGFALRSIPIIAVFLLAFGTNLKPGLNSILFLVSIILSFGINFLINFSVGMLGLYTQSSWGLDTCKELLASLFSGALIPLSFFPAFLKNIAYALPFHTIVNTPMMLLTSYELTSEKILYYFGIQLIWLIVLLLVVKIFFSKLVSRMIVNGG